MTTANTVLKSTVRNWISNRIRSTNDDYLASNDFVKFHKIEEATATNGVYSTILKDSDTSGQIEFVDTLDDGENSADKRIKIVGKNMFDDAVDSLESGINTVQSSVSTLETSTNEKLKNYLKFSTVETETDESEIFHTIIKNDKTDGGELEFLDKWDASEAQNRKVDKKMKIVGKNLFDAGIAALQGSVSALQTTITTTTQNLNNYLKFSTVETESSESGVYHTIITNDNAGGQIEIVDSLSGPESAPLAITIYSGSTVLKPSTLNLSGVNTYNSNSYVYSSALKEALDFYINSDTSSSEYESVVNESEHQDWFEAFMNEDATRYELVYNQQNQSGSAPDGKMVVAGKNMFDILEARVSQLETRLAALISAFENN